LIPSKNKNNAPTFEVFLSQFTDFVSKVVHIAFLLFRFSNGALLDLIILADKGKHKHPIFEFVQLSVEEVEFVLYFTLNTDTKIPTDFQMGMILFMRLRLSEISS